MATKHDPSFFMLPDDVAPTGVLSGPIGALCDLVRCSPTFRGWRNEGVDCGRITEAPIVYPLCRKGRGEFKFYRPFALVTLGNGFSLRRGGFGSGDLNILFEDDVNSSYAEDGLDAAAIYWFTNKVGAVLQEMMIESEKSGRLFIPDNGIRLAAGPHRSGKSEDEDYFQIMFNVAYGIH